MQELDLSKLAKKDVPQKLDVLGPTRACEISLFRVMLSSIRMVEAAIRARSDLFSGIKAQLGDQVIHDVASSRFYTKHKVRVKLPKRNGPTPLRSPLGEPWWLTTPRPPVKASDQLVKTFDTAQSFSAFIQMLRYDLDQTSGRAIGTVATAYVEEERRLRKKLGASIKAKFGIDVSDVMTAGDVRDQLQVSVNKSVSLIKGLNDDLAKKVEFTVLDAAQRGQSTSVLSERLRKEMGIARNRARLIAKDQVSSLNASLNKARQKQFGIDKYVWRTALDERVRHEHRKREGKVYSWDDPPEDGHPGEPINCRCVAIPLIESRPKS